MVSPTTACRRGFATVLGSAIAVSLCLGGSASAQTQSPAAATVPTSSDYAQRVVAYIFDTVPITREDLGEYLIARMGQDRVNNLVNKKIIEHICKQQGIEVTQAEIDADLAETLGSMGNIRTGDFVAKILKPYNKTLYEWKEDVIKPRIMLAKLCKDRVKVTEEDLKNAFEAYHGAKIQCQIILWPTSQKNVALQSYGKVRDNAEEFDRAATHQADAKLAATAGKIEPFGRHTTGNEEMEKAAFRLQPGEVSQVIETPQGYVVIKCLKHLPADATKTIETERLALTKDIMNRKVSQVEIPKLFAELREQAKPKVMMNQAKTAEDVEREIVHELKQGEKEKGVGTRNK